MHNYVSYHLDARLIMLNDLKIKMNGKNYIDYIKIYINPGKDNPNNDAIKYLDYKTLEPEEFYSINNASQHLPIIIIKFNDFVPHKDIMLEIAEKKINYILNILFVDYHLELFSYAKDLAIFKGENVNTWCMEIQNTFPLNLKQLDDLSDKLKESSILYDNHYITFYANALKAKDPEIQLTLLYNLLMELIGKETQREMDNFLISKGYSKKRKTTKKNASYKETLITWLRNVVGHTKIDYKKKYNLTWTDITKEFKEENNTLKKIVSEEIKEYYQNK